MNMIAGIIFIVMGFANISFSKQVVQGDLKF